MTTTRQMFDLSSPMSIRRGNGAAAAIAAVPHLARSSRWATAVLGERRYSKSAYVLVGVALLFALLYWYFFALSTKHLHLHLPLNRYATAEHDTFTDEEDGGRRPCYLGELPSSRWNAPATPARRVALLFMVYKDLYYAEEWASWLSQPLPDGGCAREAMPVFVHVKGLCPGELRAGDPNSKAPPAASVPEGCRRIGARVVPPVWSAYMYLGWVMQQLCRHALEEDASVDGCVFLSETCVPLKSPGDTLARLPRDISLLHSPDESFAEVSQWCFLTKGCMETFVHRLPAFGTMSVRIDGRTFGWSNACQEEYLLAVLFRAFRLPFAHSIVAYGLWRAEQLPTEYHMSIRRFWPVEMTRVDALLLRDLAKTQACFVRKVMPTAHNRRVVRAHLKSFLAH